ncbi:unnamed protein product, partial [Medioppia subpectinata]
MLRKITHVLFDLDGTLINTPELVINLFRDYAKSHGKILSKEIEMEVPNFNNMQVGFNKFMDSLNLVDVQVDRPQLMQDMVKQMLAKRYDLIPGAERLVKHLHRHGIHMAIATTNSTRFLTAVRQKLDPFLNDDHYFSHAITADNTGAVLRKPDPQVYHECVKRFKEAPDSCHNVLVVEDSM